MILTRKIGEGLTIGENIRVVVLEVRGKQVRLGIEAPLDLVVLRDEIIQRVAQENLLAASFKYCDLETLAGSGRVAKAVPLDLGVSAPAAAVPVATRDLGQVKVGEEQIFTFPLGLPGFVEFQRYALLEYPQAPPFFCLQCLDRQDLAFAVTPPGNLVEGYQLGSLQGIMRELEAKGHDDLLVLTILTIPPGQPREITANLMGPVLINRHNRRGKQIITEKPQYSAKHRVLEP